MLQLLNFGIGCLELLVIVLGFYSALKYGEVLRHGANLKKNELSNLAWCVGTCLFMILKKFGCLLLLLALLGAAGCDGTAPPKPERHKITLYSALGPIKIFISEGSVCHYHDGVSFKELVTGHEVWLYGTCTDEFLE